MELQDFREFLELLNKNRVKYLIVGGYALAYHSKPRFTGDIDIWIETNEENAEKVLNVLNEFGFGELDITKGDFMNLGQILQLGFAPNRIDIITSIDGVDFQDAWENRIEGNFGSHGIKVFFISRADFIKNKRSTGRKKDSNDIDWIKEFSPTKNN